MKSLGEYSRRIAFFVACAMLFYSLELLWQHHQRTEEDRSRNGHEKVIFIGGSAAVGLAPIIERELRVITKRSDVDVIDMSDFMMSIDEALARAKKAVETYRPKVVLFMIGMNEFSVDREWSRQARALLESGRSGQFADYLFANVDVDPISPATFVYLSRREIAKCPCRRDLVTRAQESLDAFVPIASGDARDSKRVYELLRLAQVVTFADKLGEHGAPTPEKLVDSFRQRIIGLFDAMKSWPRDARDIGYRDFVRAAGANDEEKIFRSWFWYSWPKGDIESDPLRYYTTNARDLARVVQVPLELKRHGGLEKIFPEPEYRDVVAALLAEMRDVMSRHDEKKIEDDLFESFDLGDMKDLATRSDRGTRLALVHYPGYRLPLIDEMARKFDLPVLGLQSKLPELVRTNGHFLYFYDRLKETGHLNDLGLEVYGREIAEELSKL